MDCRETRSRLANGEPLDAVMTRHLADCAGCRAYRADLDDVKRILAEPAVTPGPLRVDTLALCLDELTESPIPVEVSPLRRVGLTSPAIAALVFLGTAILIGVSIWIADASGEVAARYTVKSVFVQLVIQNFAAALLAPALWPLLRRLVVRPADPQPLIGV